MREDYSADGTAWDYFPHDHARSRAYRWNEDGLAGICDRHQRICFALALWNGRDPILKERLFGLTGNEGNHGEDVKEYYFYLDCTPTHSYMKYLYKYPQAAFPYERSRGGEPPARPRRARVRAARHRRLRRATATSTSFVEYAKADAEDILIRITVVNRGPEPAPLRPAADALVPQHLVVGADEPSAAALAARPRPGQRGHRARRRRRYGQPLALLRRRPGSCSSPRTRPTPTRLFGVAERVAVREGRHQRLRRRTAARDAVNPAQHGTKAAARLPR